MTYAVTGNNTLVPAVSVFQRNRLNSRNQKCLAGAPDLAIEVVSPTDLEVDLRTENPRVPRWRLEIAYGSSIPEARSVMVYTSRLRSRSQGRSSHHRSRSSPASPPPWPPSSSLPRPSAPMRHFFTKSIPPFSRVLLVESGSRQLFENLLPVLYRNHPDMRCDLVTCYAGAPKAFRAGSGRDLPRHRLSRQRVAPASVQGTRRQPLHHRRHYLFGRVHHDEVEMGAGRANCPAKSWW